MQPYPDNFSAVWVMLGVVYRSHDDITSSGRPAAGAAVNTLQHLFGDDHGMLGGDPTPPAVDPEADVFGGPKLG